MTTIIKIIITLIVLLASCYKPYDANIKMDTEVLVVYGMITNEMASYDVQLNYAAPFDSSGIGLPVSSAKIYITDNKGNIYFFLERGNGHYISDSLLFTGHPGNVYTLHITTFGGERYESDPQKLFPAKQPDSVYAEFDTQETLSRINGLIELSHGADILIDIKNQTDTLPHFRFTTNLVIQYYYTICPIFQLCYYYHCWQTINANTDINLTGVDYVINSAAVNKHAVCFIDDNFYCNALTYVHGPPLPDQSFVGIPTSEYKEYMVHHRIIYLLQYTLNNETYLYYKKIKEQLLSDGKLFDPIAVQLNGNIRCVTDPNKKAFGFFEASSVSSTAYTIDFRNLTNDQPSILKTPYILPPGPYGSLINKAPAFWIF